METNKQKEKRVRSCNYTGYEKNVIIDIMTKYSGIIENKRSDSLSLKKREEAWTSLTSEFNSHLNLTPRTVKQIKQCYENMKRNVKKDHSMEKIERFKTGGGTFIPSVDDTNSKLIAIIQDQLEPSQNELDCDAEYNGEIMNQNNQVIDTTEVEEIVDLPVIVRANESIAEVTTEEEELIREELTEAEIRGEINESGSSSGVPPFGSSACTTKKKTTGSKRGYSQIQELAAQSTSLCEVEKEFLIKKYRKEEQLLDIKIENAQLKQQLLKKQLEK
ncbi:myb/SANT-like DNA-binding domain-containing protein 3 [Periplaneta americana]|uniref:myb/SANT-like DNA-binding domain-containing protein 3 n=1 Tax=Periplaneta americana TaxID=6978 RepID=UPI0037E8568E